MQGTTHLRPLIGLGVLALVLCTTPLRDAAALPTGLLAWWSGDIDARDVSGQGNHGTLVGGAQAGVPGLIGGAFQFDGTSGFVSTPFRLPLPPQPPPQGTIALWVKPTVFDSIDGISIDGIFGTGGTKNGNDRLWLTLRGPDGGLGVPPYNLVVNTGSCCTNEIIASTRPTSGTDLLPTGIWTHLALTFDYGTDTYVLYVNGSIVGASTEGRDSPSQPLDFGGVRSDFNQAFYWYGLMDEVYVFDHALAPEEIADLATVVLPFTGFFPPISNPPVLNAVQGGQAIPVKFRLGGNQGLDVFAPGYPKSKAVPCEPDDLVNDVQPTEAAGGSGLTYNPATDTYTYVWKTEKTWRKSCRTLLLQLTDGVIHTADFRFK